MVSPDTFKHVDSKYLHELSTTPGEFAFGVGEFKYYFVMCLIDIIIFVVNGIECRRIFGNYSASYFRQVGGFLRVLWFPPPIKLTATI